MTSVTQRFEFDAAHRVLGHEGKCRFLHGHRYAAEITLVAKELDKLGMVIDFSKIKEIVGTWIDEYWDHNIILHCDDPLVELEKKSSQWKDIFESKTPYILTKLMGNPTAEVLAWLLYRTSQSMFEDTKIPVKITQVRIYETPKCWADYVPSLGDLK